LGSLIAARAGLTRELRVDMANMHVGRLRTIAGLYLSCCDRRIPLFAQNMVGQRFEGPSARCAEIA
jgi:hypothetical protein